MKDLIVSEDIIPVGEFKKHASRLFRRVKETERPILITQNGSPISVVISPQEFDRIRERARLVAAVEEGFRQSKSDEVLSGEKADRELDREFGRLKKKK
jgi:prevent-host-death family protein